MENIKKDMINLGFWPLHWLLPLPLQTLTLLYGLGVMSKKSSIFKDFVQIGGGEVNPS